MMDKLKVKINLTPTQCMITYANIMNIFSFVNNVQKSVTNSYTWITTECSYSMSESGYYYISVDRRPLK